MEQRGRGEAWMEEGRIGGRKGIRLVENEVVRAEEWQGGERRQGGRQGVKEGGR